MQKKMNKYLKKYLEITKRIAYFVAVKQKSIL